MREADALRPKPVVERPERVKVASGVTQGLLIKKVPPFYPSEARVAYIQGTVLLRAETARRVTLPILNSWMTHSNWRFGGGRGASWNYKPYLLMGQPVTVDTQIQSTISFARETPILIPVRTIVLLI
jgi:hypothetical protein